MLNNFMFCLSTHNSFEFSLTTRFVNHDSVRPNVKVEVIYHKIMARDSRYEGKRNQNSPKTHVDLKENHGIESPKSLTLVQENSRVRKDGILYSSNSPGEGFQIRMSALRTILEGEELRFDYGPLYSPAAGWAM
jgi:hypothetical protein